MIAFNVLLVPEIGYWACAWGGFAGYGTAMLLSFLLGRKRYPVPYDWKTIMLYAGLALGLLILSAFLPQLIGRELPTAATLAVNTLLLAAYCLPVARKFILKHKTT